MTRRGRSSAGMGCLAFCIVAACASSGSRAPDCDLGPATAPADSTGVYALDLWTADDARASGDLTLWRRAAADQVVAGPAGPAEGIRQTHWGFSDADVDEVGAVAPGRVDSADSPSPGVAVYWTPEYTLLRFGSEANRRDRVRFDGAHLTLTVERWTERGFDGTWNSFGGDAPEAEGRFCAMSSAAAGGG